MMVSHSKEAELVLVSERTGKISDLPAFQRNLLELSFPSAEAVRSIPSGFPFPEDLIKRYFAQAIKKNAFIIDCGCGNCGKAERLAKLGCSVIALDISPAVIDLALERYGSGSGNLSIFPVLRDICSESSSKDDFIKSCSPLGLLSLGLFPYLVGNMVEKAVQTMADLLTPGGKVINGNCLKISGDCLEPIARNAPGGENFSWAKKYIGKWQERYRANQAILTEEGTFLVYKVGPKKAEEFGLEEELRLALSLFGLDSFPIERLARHWQLEEEKRIFKENGFSLIDQETLIVFSRQEFPLPVSLSVYEKI